MKNHLPSFKLDKYFTSLPTDYNLIHYNIYLLGVKIINMLCCDKFFFPKLQQLHLFSSRSALLGNEVTDQQIDVDEPDNKPASQHCDETEKEATDQQQLPSTFGKLSGRQSGSLVGWQSVAIVAHQCIFILINEPPSYDIFCSFYKKLKKKL